MALLGIAAGCVLYFPADAFDGGLRASPRHYAQLTGLPNAAASQAAGDDAAAQPAYHLVGVLSCGIPADFFRESCLECAARRGCPGEPVAGDNDGVDARPLCPRREERELRPAVYREPAHYDDRLVDPTPRPQWQPPR